jgi:segregation and condensation protein B
MEQTQIKKIIEAALMAVDKPLPMKQIQSLFRTDDVEKADVNKALVDLQEEYSERGVSIVEVASGYRVQIDQDVSPWISKLFEERPPRYTRALLETLALIAYRQPITRSEIEEVRGVAVSTNIIKTLLEREWVQVVGHKEVPGRPAMYATTKEFLDYFNLKRIDELPPLSELTDLDAIDTQLEMPIPAKETENVEGEEGESDTAQSDDDESSDEGEEIVEGIAEELAEHAGDSSGNVTLH